MAFVETGDASEAYKRSYNAENMLPATINVKACLVKARDNVRVRIQELMAELKDKYDLTMHDLIAQLEEARQLALSIEQPASMISATMGSAKLLGLDKPVPDDDEKGQKLDITFNVSSAVDDIKVTTGKNE